MTGPEVGRPHIPTSPEFRNAPRGTSLGEERQTAGFQSEILKVMILWFLPLGCWGYKCVWFIWYWGAKVGPHTC